MRRLLTLTMLQRGLSVAIYLAATMIIARLLTPAQIGVFSLSAAVVSIAGVVREFGISEYLMKERQLDERRIRAAFGVAIAVGWTVGAFILLIRHPVARFYGEPGVAQVLTVLALTFTFLPLATPVTALLYREMALERVLWIQTLSLIVGHVASVVFAWRGFGFMALAWGTVVNSACMVLTLLLTRPSSLRVLPSLRGSAAVWSYCTKFTLSGTLDTTSRSVHEFIIGRTLGFAALGLFSRANGLFVQFNQNVGRGISRVLLPNFARHARNDDSGNLRVEYGKTLQMYTAFVWPMYAVVAVVSGEIIGVLFGSQWLEAGPLLRLLCLGAIVQAGYGFASELLGGMGQAGARLRITALGTPLWVVLCAVAATISLQAIALAFAVNAAVLLLLYLRQLGRLLAFTPADWFAATRSSAVLTLMVALCALAVRTALQAWHAVPFVTLLVVGGLSAIAWLLGALALAHPAGKEARIAFMAVARRIGLASPAVGAIGLERNAG